MNLDHRQEQEKATEQRARIHSRRYPANVTRCNAIGPVSCLPIVSEISLAVSDSQKCHGSRSRRLAKTIGRWDFPPVLHRRMFPAAKAGVRRRQHTKPKPFDFCRVTVLEQSSIDACREV